MAGAKGKVNSAPIPIDEGMIGTRKVPKIQHVTFITQKLPSGIMKREAKSIAKVIQQTTLIVMR